MFFKSNTMNLNVINKVGYLTFKMFEKYECINHAFSTRLGGVSSNEFESMNLCFHMGDLDSNVIENYKIFCSAAGFDFDSLVASRQKHGTNIIKVGVNDRGKGIYKEQYGEDADGLITNEKGITLVTYHADCTPIFFLDPEKKVIALAHAGWRGTVGEIACNMIDKMLNIYGSETEDIICGIGPSIGRCCYEVDEAVYNSFIKIKGIDINKAITKCENNKYLLDLCEVNKQLLIKKGIKEYNIQVSDVCTKCNNNLLFSHRATPKHGEMASMISLR